MKINIINKIIEISKDLEKTPTGLEFYKLSGYSKRTITNIFGSYNQLIKEANLKPKRIMQKFNRNCKQCNKEILLPNYKLKKNNFCSLKCSNIFNNPKINKITICENCNLNFTKSKDKVSNTCSKLCHIELGMKHRLIKDSIKREGSNTYDTIRKNARIYSKYFYPLKCMLCDYDKHYEVCHIKDLKNFTGEETIYEVNNKYNLIHLCPNHHWEFDHNQLDIQKIREAQKAAITN